MGQNKTTEQLDPMFDTADAGVIERLDTVSAIPTPCIHRRVWGLGFLIAAGFLYLYAGVLASLVHQWWSNDTLSFGFLIPWISLYFIWIRRKSLLQIQPVPNYIAGPGILLTGLSMLILGHAGSVLILQELSLIVTIAGLVLLFLGVCFLRALRFPIAYLLFMTPAWGIVTEQIQFPFQNFSAIIGTTLLHSIGIPAYQQGIYIELPGLTLEVANVCSGVGYLISVIAIGIPLACLYLKSWPKRAILLSYAVIISILANGLRVALIGVIAYYYSGWDIHGPFHILQGLFVSVIGFIALFTGLWVLSERHSKSSPTLYNVQSISDQIQPLIRRRGIPYLGASIFIFFLLIGSYLHFYNPSPVPLKLAFEYFPLEIGEWKGGTIAPGYSVYRTLRVDQDISRIYRNLSGEDVRLYIGYYESQEQEKELINDKVNNLYYHTSEIKVDIDSHTSIKVNKTIFPPSHKLILFWYDINGRIVTDRYMVKIYSIWDALIYGRTNGAVIMVISEFRTSEDLEKLLSNNKNFIQEIFPLLRRYLPQV